MIIKKYSILLVYFLFCFTYLSGQTKSEFGSGTPIYYDWHSLTNPELLNPNISTKPTISRKIPKKGIQTIATFKRIEIKPTVIQKSDFHRPITQTIKFIPKDLKDVEKVNVSFFQYKDHSFYNFKYSDKSHGFFSNAISAIAQDNDGEMWVASLMDGLCKYNGTSMRLISEENGLPSNSINHILFDSQNRLWVGTEKGICYIKNNQIYLTNNDSLTTPIRTIYEDKSGNIWIGTKQKGVFKFDGNSITIYNKNTGLNSNWVNSILEDSKGNFWFGFNSYGFCKIKGNETIQFIVKQNEKYDAQCVFEDSKSNIWISFFGATPICYKEDAFFECNLTSNSDERIYDIKENKNGLWFALYSNEIGLVNLKNGKIKQYSPAEGLPSRLIYKLCIDNTDNIWLASLYGGIGRFDNNSFSANNPEKEIPMNISEGITKDRKNRTWYLPNGDYIIRDDKSYYTSFINESDSIYRKLMYSWDAHFLPDGSAWFATYSIGIVKFIPKEFKFFMFENGNYIIDISALNDSNICFATMKNGLINLKNNKFYSYTETQGLVSNSINVCFYDSSGKLWIGTNSGLNIITDNKIVKLDENTGLSSNTIDFFYEDSLTRMWIATENGIDIIDGEKKYSITTKNGLISNKIRSIVQDNQGDFWIATNIGISKIKFTSKNKFTVSNYGNNYGLKITDFNSTVYVFDDGKISWGTNIGILNYNPDNKNTYIKPKLNLCNFYIENNVKKKLDINENKIINIEPNTKFEISFTAIDWGFENAITYEYAIMKNETDTIWRNLGQSNNLILQDVTHGEYKLLIKAKGHAGYSNIKMLNIKFLPHWWQTIWFIVILIVVFLGAVFLVYFLRHRAMKKRNEILQQIVFEKTIELLKENKIKDALISEIHHRVKNNLQTISSLIYFQLKNAPDEENRTSLRSIETRINSMSTIHEMLYSNDDDTVISLNAFIKAFVKSLNAMIDNKNQSIEIIYNIKDIEINISQAITLGLMISEIITNSIKYAFNDTKKPKIDINIYKQNKKIFFSIKDNGCGVEKNILKGKQGSLGFKLINIFARQLNAEMNIENNNGLEFQFNFKVN